MLKWWIYQKERFPVFQHGILIAAFSCSAVSYSALLRSSESAPGWSALVTAFIVCFLSFLLLRIADEFKDYDDDCKFRPTRPVPRGLIKLNELGWLASFCVGIQLLISVWLSPPLLVPLVLMLMYLVLMSTEFFVPVWLKRHPITYMWSHMLIMPLIDLYATACDWLVSGQSVPHPGLAWFLLVSFFNGVVIEIGRKIRIPESEQEGVETYSKLWGAKKATFIWLAMILVTGIFALIAAQSIQFFTIASCLLAILLALCLLATYRFIKYPSNKTAKHIEVMAGIWTLFMYLSLGVIPLSILLVNKL